GSYKGVGQQSGLFAGDGGYHVDAGHVNLIGGAIASTNAAGSELTAETLTFTDLKNEMDYRASSAGISGGFGFTGKGATDASGNPAPAPGAAGQFKDIGNTIRNGEYGAANSASFSPGIPMSESGHDSSTTYATLTGGDITIGGKKVDAADLGVNTDASAAHQALEGLPDLQKILQEQRAMAQATGTVVDAGMRIRADINASIDNAKERRDGANELLSDPGSRDSMTQEQRDQLLMTAIEANQEIDRLQKAGVLVGAITGGLAASSGTAGQIVAGTLAPAVSYQIGQYFKDNAALNKNDNGNRAVEGSATHLLAHALLGAAVASSGGDSALIGALAAGSAEAAAPAIAKLLFGRDSKDLTAAEQDTVSAITGVGGAMLGMFRDGLSGAAAGGTAAKNAVDNNWGEVGHYSTVATILYLGGFDENLAKAVALGAWSPDTDHRNAITTENVTKGRDPDEPQMYYHGLDGEVDPEKVKEAQVYWGKKVGNILKALVMFENYPALQEKLMNDPKTQRALHLFGDSYAHVKEDGTHFSPVYGHAWDSKLGTDPDSPYEHKEAYIQYATALYELAAAASKEAPRRDSAYVRDMAQSVTGYWDEAYQKQVLDNAASLFTGGRTSGLVNSPIKDCGLLQNCLFKLPANTANPLIKQLLNPDKNLDNPAPPVIDWTKFGTRLW
ncbi:VENN motif pre-toxin domain-containing protein, partial [Stenotrophomonas sp. 22385]|uniref:VENN motif pre-toxin domain-containing protein n=1 Tax=Stenotrophomonas sp. 22385 TaxID=3453915 RepID=UPI003F84A8B5